MMHGLVLAISMLAAAPTPSTPVGSPQDVQPITESYDGIAVDQLLRQARTALDSGDNQRALAALAAARAKMESPDPRMIFNEAVAAYNTGDYATARDLF
ncbi:MAG: hypothetical protein VX527_08450, partial [Planctomycetota bacterium]|nr:hypothetical protein [Planctomycetota bacterium]